MQPLAYLGEPGAELAGFAMHTITEFLDLTHSLTHSFAFPQCALGANWEGLDTAC
jgi:hypothetical protein